MNINRTLLIVVTCLIAWFTSPIISPAFKVVENLLGFSSDAYADGTSANYGDNYCGNSVLEQPPEQCDDGNNQNGDGCSAVCTIEVLPPFCGDRNLDSGEECDDGNVVNGDGCSQFCQAEAPKDLVAHYEFQMDFKDISGMNNNGISHGGIRFDSISMGNYFPKFDGIDDYIEVPNSASLNLGPMTLSYWVKPDLKDYAGKVYTVLHKGSASTEYSHGLIGETPGVGVVPGSDDIPELSAPSNLVAQYGGLNAAGKQVIHLSWEDNSSNEDGFVIEITDQDSNCGDCPTQLPADTTFFQAEAENDLDLHEVRVYVYKGALKSEKAIARVRTDGTDPDPIITPASNRIPRDNKFHHVVESRNESGVYKYYLDGRLISTMNGGPIHHGTDVLRIGASRPPAEVTFTQSYDAGMVTLMWNSTVGEKYAVQYRNVEVSTWLNVSGIVKADGTTASKVFPSEYGLVYRVLHLDGDPFAGSLDKVMVYNRQLSDAEITDLYAKQNSRLKSIDFRFVRAEKFAKLPEAEFSKAMDDLEKISQKYESAWKGIPESIKTVHKAEPYLHVRWERQLRFFKEQLQLMEKYNLLHGKKAQDVINIYEPKWQRQRVNHVWLREYDPARPTASMSTTSTVSATTLASTTTSTNLLSNIPLVENLQNTSEYQDFKNKFNNMYSAKMSMAAKVTPTTKKKLNVKSAKMSTASGAQTAQASGSCQIDPTCGGPYSPDGYPCDCGCSHVETGEGPEAPDEDATEAPADDSADEQDPAQLWVVSQDGGVFDSESSACGEFDTYEMLRVEMSLTYPAPERPVITSGFEVRQTWKQPQIFTTSYLGKTDWTWWNPPNGWRKAVGTLLPNIPGSYAAPDFLRFSGVMDWVTSADPDHLFDDGMPLNLSFCGPATGTNGYFKDAIILPPRSAIYPDLGTEFNANGELYFGAAIQSILDSPTLKKQTEDGLIGWFHSNHDFWYGKHYIAENVSVGWKHDLDEVMYPIYDTDTWEQKCGKMEARSGVSIINMVFRLDIDF